MKHPDHTVNLKVAERAALARRTEIASILAAAIVRRRQRDVRNHLKKNGKTEKVLEV